MLPDRSLAICVVEILRSKEPLVDQLPYGGVWATIPSILSQREIDAIQHGTIFVGMQEFALDAAMVVEGRSMPNQVSKVTSGPLTIYLDGTLDARVIRWNGRTSSRQPVHGSVNGGSH
jgi:hypothetical protein